MGTVAQHIEVNVPITQAYNWWRGLTNLPRILPDVESVEPTGGTTQLTHWTVHGPLGRRVEWDAKITEDIPNEKIAWTSVEGPGTQLRNAGAVRFEDHGQTTGVAVTLDYDPPAALAGAAAAMLFTDPQEKVEGALAAFKQAVESAMEPSASADSAPERR